MIPFKFDCFSKLPQKLDDDNLKKSKRMSKNLNIHQNPMGKNENIKVSPEVQVLLQLFP